uniref:DUF4283 domain-containing protein n=1 Tax=Fagus sylvatica TaxID=28930 RepID=A0A2N9FGX7_FAGSY
MMKALMKRLRNILEGMASVRLSKETKLLIRSKWATALIVKVFGKSVGYHYLHSRILNLWKPAGRLECVDLGKDFFLIRFGLVDDFDFVLKNGPWFIAAAVQEEKKSTLHLGLKKGAWILCIAEGKALLSWLGLLAALAGLAGFAGCGPAGFAGWALLVGLLPCSFQQPACCYCFIFLFLLLFHGKLLGALCPLYSRLACELIKALLEPQFV